MPGPLDGIRIIDLTAIVLGPVATMHLADMGADVIKIEPPEGDVIRQPGNSRSPKMGPIYLGANRNKRSLCLDLKRPEAIEIVKRLIATADVFAHNSRPQAIERLGLGYDTLKAINPRLVYALRTRLQPRRPLRPQGRPTTTSCRARAGPPCCSRGSTAGRRASCRA